MDRYEQLSVIGEGSYGVVLKCRHKESDQIVAIKKFLETEEDAGVRRMALREIRMLKKLKHENLVTMLEVFRHRKRFYLVFEYMVGTVLDELEKTPGGLSKDKCRERIFQVTRAIHYCHSLNIIHRDVKPENVLVSSLGVVKLCDFGFARLISVTADPCTEYVATRWYRAPELLVGDANYGAGVDIWAIGCLFAEMMTGEPLFPGESDIDQLYLIVKTIGMPSLRHQQIMAKNSQMRGMTRSAVSDFSGFYKSFANWSLITLDFLVCCMKMDPELRPTSDELLKHNYFTHDKFSQRFLPALRDKVNIEFNNNPLLRKFKAEILISSDKKDEHKVRRSSQVEPPRWRLNVIEGSVKRKFSCESDLGTAHSSSFTYRNKSFIKPTASSFYDLASVNESEINIIEKGLESLTRISNGRSFTDKKSDEDESLHQIQTFAQTPFKSNVLHPCINNITFKDPLKKSPNILQSIHNTSIKGTFNQVPLVNAPRGLTKKLERNVVVNNMLVNIEPVNLGYNWKRKEVKNKDDFTLPNLPGATGSPYKPKRKNDCICPDGVTNKTISPEMRYRRAKRKHVCLEDCRLYRRRPNFS